jgi:hypothetical protein
VYLQGLQVPSRLLMRSWRARAVDRAHGRRRFTHASIADADPVSGEARLGIVAHYSIGIGFAALLLAWRITQTE